MVVNKSVGVRASFIAKPEVAMLRGSVAYRDSVSLSDIRLLLVQICKSGELYVLQLFPGDVFADGFFIYAPQSVSVLRAWSLC